MPDGRSRDDVDDFFDKVKGGRVHNDLDWPSNAIAALRDEDGALVEHK